MLIHIGETAALLLIAYSMGWVVGYVARRGSAATRQKPAAVIPADRLAAAKGEVPAADALVTAPIVAPLKPAPLPKVSPLPEQAVTILGELGKLAVPDQPPVATIAMDTTTPTEPEQVASAAPAASSEAAVAIAAETSPLPDIATNVIDAAAKSEAAAEPPSAIAEAPVPAAPEVSAVPAMPANRAGEAWAGEIRGHASARHDQLLQGQAEAEVPPPQPVEEPAAQIQPRLQPDEDAAMRAIEGGWSRRDAHALPDEPELIGVVAAVTAAQSAVEKALAKLEDETSVDATTKS